MATSSRALAGVVAGVLAVVTANSAYANWARPSSTAVRATEAVTIFVHNESTTLLAPGVTQRLTFTADNAGSTSHFVRTVTSVATVDAAHANRCPAGSFVVSPLESNTSVAAGARGVALGSSTITFTDSAANQDGCQGATITVTATSS